MRRLPGCLFACCSHVNLAVWTPHVNWRARLWNFPTCSPSAHSLSLHQQVGSIIVGSCGYPARSDTPTADPQDKHEETSITPVFLTNIFGGATSCPSPSPRLPQQGAVVQAKQRTETSPEKGCELNARYPCLLHKLRRNSESPHIVRILESRRVKHAQQTSQSKNTPTKYRVCFPC